MFVPRKREMAVPTRIGAKMKRQFLGPARTHGTQIISGFIRNRFLAEVAEFPIIWLFGGFGHNGYCIKSQDSMRSHFATALNLLL